MVKGEPPIYRNSRKTNPRDHKSRNNPVIRFTDKYKQIYEDKKEEADQIVERARGPVTPEKKKEIDELADQFEQWLLNIFSMGLSAATKNKVVGYAVKTGYRTYRYQSTRGGYQKSSGERNYVYQGKTGYNNGNSRKATSSNGYRKPYEQR
jgi:hypothetical protein